MRRPPYFADRFRATMVYTNPQTGLTYTVVRVRQSKDLRIVDNGDGTLTLMLRPPEASCLAYVRAGG
jgi:hypothetical protein